MLRYNEPNFSKTSEVMRIKPENLSNELKKALQPVYLLTGDEPLQLIESADMLRRVARKQGFTERQVFHVEQGFDWGLLLQEANSMSLFAEKKVLELRFTSPKPGDAGSKAICEYCQRISPDNLLIVSMPKLDKRSQSAKWFKALENNGVVIQSWPIEGGQLSQWIVRRMQSRELTADRDAVSLLTEKVEGNLLAAAQEIEKLSLKAPAKITAEDILESSSDDAKYDVYKLVDAAIAGNYKRFAKILTGLKAGGEAPSLVLWAFTREIRSMVTMSHDVRQGVSLGQVLSKHHVWDNRAAVVKAGLTRFKVDQWLGLLGRAIRVDQVIKGLHNGDVWDELLDLGFSISGKEILGTRV